MCRSEPAPIQTRSWPSSSPAISTCATPGAGNGATPPGSKPVAARTSSGRATRARRAPAAAATLVSSARRSPGTSASVGRPSQMKTSDLTIWARERRRPSPRRPRWACPPETPRRARRCRRAAAPLRPARPAPASASRLVAHGAELEHPRVVEALAAQPLDELRRRRRVDGERHQRLAALPAARDGHAGDVDRRLRRTASRRGRSRRARRRSGRARRAARARARSRSRGC